MLSNIREENRVTNPIASQLRVLIHHALFSWELTWEFPWELLWGFSCAFVCTNLLKSEFYQSLVHRRPAALNCIKLPMGLSMGIPMKITIAYQDA